jgi:hypothetical protein
MPLREEGRRGPGDTRFWMGVLACLDIVQYFFRCTINNVILFPEF